MFWSPWLTPHLMGKQTGQYFIHEDSQLYPGSKCFMEQRNACLSVPSRYRCHRPSWFPWKSASCSGHVPGSREGSTGLTCRHQSYVRQGVWVGWGRGGACLWHTVTSCSLRCNLERFGWRWKEGTLWVRSFINMEWNGCVERKLSGGRVFLNRISVTSSCQQTLICTTSNAKTFPKSCELEGWNSRLKSGWNEI